MTPCLPTYCTLSGLPLHPRYLVHEQVLDKGLPADEGSPQGAVGTSASPSPPLVSPTTASSPFLSVSPVSLLFPPWQPSPGSSASSVLLAVLDLKVSLAELDFQLQALRASRSEEPGDDSQLSGPSPHFSQTFSHLPPAAFLAFRT